MTTVASAFSTSLAHEHDDDNDDRSRSSDDRSSSSSSSSSYGDPSSNDLTVAGASSLLLADVVGTGILALPHDIKVLGVGYGLSFLLLSAAVNWYAGTIMCRAADHVEGGKSRGYGVDDRGRSRNGDVGIGGGGSAPPVEEVGGGSAPPAVEEVYEAVVLANSGGESLADKSEPPGWLSEDRAVPPDESGHHRHHVDIATYDLIGMTAALFDPPHHRHRRLSHRDEGGNVGGLRRRRCDCGCGTATAWVIATFYLSVFLVLGNYVLVMSRAVAALVGEDRICLPAAGAVASCLMFGLSQLDTMAKLGKGATAVSLAALVAVVTQCLVAVRNGGEDLIVDDDDDAADEKGEVIDSILRQLAALSSVTFAFGSQKLLLNIRHEMKRRDKAAPEALGISLVIIASAYVVVCLLAGSDPPGILFDAIPKGTANRRVAGLFLWLHVAVSYAINSQALCSSVDRIGLHRVTAFGLHERHKVRWAATTFVVAASSYLVANAVPFFKDLVALIGTLSGIPLTLLLPALFHRKVSRVPLFKPSRGSLTSYLLVVFCLAFFVCGLCGSLGSIELDWEHAHGPFQCE